MGRQYKPRLIPEQNQRICGSICFCQLTMVMSCVALVYLTVAIYMPSHRAFKSGLEPEPVMCMTINTTMANNCQWASCGEWCLTKTSGFCPQIHVIVRRNGTDLRLSNCTTSINVSCPPADLGSLKKFNCNQGDECDDLTGVFNCTKGHCTNMSALYQCQPKVDGVGIINSEKDNLKLNGDFLCNLSKCNKIKEGMQCDRRCPEGIPTRKVNVYLMHGDSVLASQCEVAYSLHEANGTAPGRPINATQFWTKEDGSVLLASCLDVTRMTHGVVNATDCVNGTLIDPKNMPKAIETNFTVFWKLYADSMFRPADPLHRYVPLQSEITIYNNSRLYINLEACVNTLQGECRDFLNSHGRDGDNRTAESRFPCFYDKDKSFFVVARFDLGKTLRELIIAVAVPTVLFVASWATLCIITRSVNVGDDARMRCKYCAGGEVDECDQREEETNMISCNSDHDAIARDNRAMAQTA